jgi:hypothetical protein
MRALFGWTRNPVGLVGAVVATVSAILFVTLFLIAALGFHAGPYLGLLAFVGVPSLLVLGLALIPVGAWLDRRKARRAGGDAEPPLPILDLNEERIRRRVLLFAGLTAANLVIVALASYKAVEVMDSPAFCGSCHSVMDPEFTAWKRSPHARVPCADCHIGPGADWFVKSKLSGSWQLVSVTLGLYPRPIPTPVENLRPARETCEQCHWPTKFVGRRFKVKTGFADDEANTEKKTVLLLEVGGGDGPRAEGIHWHVGQGVQVRYRADPKRENVAEVELSLPDGTRKSWKGKAQLPANAPWRTMDCVDCHNRPTHVYRQPEEEIDGLLAAGRIDRSLPFVRKEGLAALKAEYPSQAEARSGIGARLLAYYEKSHPQVLAAKRPAVEAAAAALGDAYAVNVWPQMKIAWGTYPTQLGHTVASGCFRCHDGDHVAEGGQAISQDCGLCHTLLANDEVDPPILKQLK